MDETGTYGQFGQAVYDPDEKEWHFERSTKEFHVWKAPGELKAITGPQIHSAAHPRVKDGKEGASRRRENQAKALVKVHPELHPASDLLPDLSRISEAVEEASARHDPAIGNLLAFGIITDELAKRRVEVAAFPSGPTGSDLRIVQVQNQGRGWDPSQSTYLQVPTIYGEEAIWKGPGVSIQYITFARPLEIDDAFLAVRLISETLIFRPVFRKRSVLGGSRLDVNLSHSLNIAETGDSPHSDVAFNPWYSRQLAVLDQAGSWTIWELGDKQTSVVKQLCAHGREAKKTFLNECWGRVIWVGGSSTIAVCSRRDLMIYQIGEKDPEKLHDLDIGLDDGLSWILDMALVPSRPNYLIVLTSAHVLLAYVEVGQVRAIEARIIARVRHFRNPEDISLRMYCSVGEDGKNLFGSISSSCC